jgi:hypothetical protein
MRAGEDQHQDVGVLEGLVGVGLAVDARQRKCRQRRTDCECGRLLDASDAPANASRNVTTTERM